MSVYFLRLFVQLATGHTCSTVKICEHCDSMKQQASIWLQLSNTAVVKQDILCCLAARALLLLFNRTDLCQDWLTHCCGCFHTANMPLDSLH